MPCTCESVPAANPIGNCWSTDRILLSAGSYSKGEVHPLALLLLSEQRVSTEGLRSKSWDEFAKPGAPVMNFVFTVCDQTAGEVCQVWPGQLYGAAGLVVHRGCVPGSHRADGSPSRSLSRRLH
jgi:arsenate reductase